jgi:PAS domain S-box-containing protein
MRVHLFLVLLIVGSLAAADEGPRRVLLVHSFGRDFSPFSEVAARFRTRLAELSPEPVEFMDAPLEMARFDGEDRDRPLLDFLESIYLNQPPDLLVPVGAPAAMFANRHRDTLFPGSPVLMLSADRRRMKGSDHGPSLTSVGVETNLAVLLSNITDLLPQTENIYVVGGTSPMERYWESELRREWTSHGKQIRFHWLTDHPVAEIEDMVRDLPANSAVAVGIINRDAAGIPYESASALRAIRATTSAPIFGYSEHQLGDGVVGGRLAPMPRVGDVGAEVAARILGGQSPADIAPSYLTLAAPTYDWRELKRWNIPESSLPSGATILFREPGLWETHRSAVLLTVGFLVLQTALIAGLLTARRRARDTDASLSLAADAAKIGLWRRDPRSGDFVVNARWRRIFGFPQSGRLSADEVLGQIPAEDREKVLSAIDLAARAGREFSLEHRVAHPDGSVRWVATHGRLEPGRNGHAPGTRGATLDITERREASAMAALQRQELAHLSRVSSLGVLSGALAHELNQPLGIILSNAQAAEFLLEAEAPDLIELRAILSDIVREDRRAGDVIKRSRGASAHPQRPHRPQCRGGSPPCRRPAVHQGGPGAAPAGVIEPDPQRLRRHGGESSAGTGA